MAEQPEVNEEGVEVTKVVAPDATMPSATYQDPSKDKEAPRIEIVLASLLIPATGDSKGADQGSSDAAIQQAKAPPQGKIVIKKK